VVFIYPGDTTLEIVSVPWLVNFHRLKLEQPSIISLLEEEVPYRYGVF
jgi:hypothetical protein